MHDIMAQKNTLSHKRAYINCLHSVNYKERAGLILSGCLAAINSCIYSTCNTARK